MLAILRSTSLLMAIGLGGGLGPVVGLTASAHPAKEKVTVEKVEYQGWKNNLKLTNGEVELVVTLDVGPRVIHYGFVGGRNVFKEYPEQVGKQGETEWKIRGGHRLWVAPEDPKRTYVPDNASVRQQSIEGGRVRLTPNPEQPYGLQKEIEVQLASSGSLVTLVHRIKNVGRDPTDLAAWSLTVVRPGGTEIIPLPPKQAHPKALLPNQLLVLWPYFDFKDPRFTFGSQYILVRQDAQGGPTKIGLAHKMGWIGYWNEGTLFMKRFAFQEGQNYPDHGCNFETFTNQEMLEMESLSPLVRLTPGAAIEHTERWELHKDIPAIRDESDIEKHIGPRVHP
jgi:hypothetical protein